MIKFKNKFLIFPILMSIFLVGCENEKEVLRYEDTEVVRVITDENGEIIQEDSIRGVDGLSEEEERAKKINYALDVYRAISDGKNVDIDREYFDEGAKLFKEDIARLEEVNKLMENNFKE